MISESMLDQLRRLHSHSDARCLVAHCSSQGVTLRLPRSGCVCVDCDSCEAFSPSESKPDYIGIDANDSGDYWFVLEMKTSVRDFRSAVSQLQAGADKIRNSSAFRVSGAPISLVPIIVHGRGRVRMSDKDRNRSVLFGGVKFRVQMRRSGDTL